MPHDTETLVRDLERRRFDAIVAGDWDGWAALCDADLRYTHASGVIDTRDSYLTKLRGGHYDYHRINSTIDTTLVTPDLALVWGTMVSDLRAGNRQISIDNVTVSAWVRRSSSWLLVAHQSTAAQSGTA